MVCELFFMPLDEVIKTYSGRFPKNVEWVHLYNPEIEIAFWAELYKPRQGHSGRRSILTDELCGGAGSRFMVCSPSSVDKVAMELEHALDTREETQTRLAEAQDKREKNRKKKERQRAKKAEAKAELEAEEKRQKEEAEAEEIEALRAAKIKAPMLQGVDFASMLKPKAAATASAADVS